MLTHSGGLGRAIFFWGVGRVIPDLSPFTDFFPLCPEDLPHIAPILKYHWRRFPTQAMLITPPWILQNSLCDVFTP